MPNTNTSPSTTLRRSPRLLHQPPPQQPRTPRKPQHSSSSSATSTRKSVSYSSNPSSSSSDTFQFALSSQTHHRKGFNNNSSGNVYSAPPQLRRSPRFNINNSLRRSPRLSHRTIQFLQLSDSRKPSSSSSSSKKSTKSENDSVVNSEKSMKSGNDSVVNSKKSMRLKSPRRSQRLLKNEKGVRVKNMECDSDFGVEVEVEERRIGGKRKREEIENNNNGWSKEQEAALQRAYLAAKPTPHFWKKVSRLVPGKSAQDCFERIHQDHLTPRQHQPRSRAKKLKSSPLEEVLLSASKLLKPIVNKARRSGCSKSKSYLTQKSLKKLLQFNRKVDTDHEGDLFSVLEPNVDFPTNAFQPSCALSTPEKLDERQGRLQSCNEKSSLRHGRPLSRFNSPCGPDIVSPPVLKQVKNRVLHEKYINQLRCREARRRAASAQVEISKHGIAVSKESNVQKGGPVESAKIALVSEARDAIEKFQHSQTNLMEGCISDEDNGDDTKSFDDEDESQ